MFKNITKMLENSLNLKEPWEIIGVEFSEEDNAAHITVDVKKGAQFACPKCESQTKRYGYEPNERVWRHGDICFFPCYVHCRRPRVQCPKCGVEQINAPFERKNSRFTLMFESYAMMILTDMPVAKASRVLRCDEKCSSCICKFIIAKYAFLFPRNSCP